MTTKKSKKKPPPLTEDMVVEVNITDDMVLKARKLSSEMGVLRNSIMKGDGNIYGFLGELMVANYFGVFPANSYDYDLILPNGMSVDVKTKSTSVKPKLVYDCSIAAYNTKQQCDAYVFCRVKNNMTVGWILGYATKKDYFKRASLLKKGDFDPSNNFSVKADCYNMKISELNNIAELTTEEQDLD